MTSKLFIGRIVADHLGTLRSVRNERGSPLDLFVFYSLPLVLAEALWLSKWQMPALFGNAVLTSVSIVTGLMFSVLALLYQARHSDGGRDAIARARLQEIFHNVSYMILDIVKN